MNNESPLLSKKRLKLSMNDNDQLEDEIMKSDVTNPTEKSPSQQKNDDTSNLIEKLDDSSASIDSKPARKTKETSFDFEIFRCSIHRSYKQISVSRKMRKFYARRYQLFRRFDSGILLDAESWFSVTPEAVAAHVAARCYHSLTSSPHAHAKSRPLTVLDAFCGSGGNTIQFGQIFDHVLAVDIDFVKLQCAQHNSTLYGTSHKTSFIMQDFFQLHKMLDVVERGIDLVFMSPPWGGVDYFHRRETDLSELPLDTFRLFLYCVQKLRCRNLVFFLPRNSNLEQVAYMAGVGGRVEIEQNFLGHKFVAISAYFGEIVEKDERKFAEKI